MDTKICRVCNIEKTLDLFHISLQRGVENRCLACTKEYNNRYYQSNREELLIKSAEYNVENKERRASYYKEYRVKNKQLLDEKEMIRKFGINDEQYQKILVKQGGGCATCGRKEQWRRMPIDHDHTCCPGKKSCGNCIRGILCDYCNRAMGLLQDDVVILQNMIKYLK